MIGIERLSDLDELILRCRTEKAREYISEAVACYRSGAYRASIVNTWIAVVFDLIDKTRELSVAGEKNAEAILKKFETYQQQISEGNSQGINSALEFERNILVTAKDELQFFDVQQLQDLTRLREDRHRCAHPSFQKIEEPYRPSAEQARLHLRNAIIHVLSQPPVQGKAAIEDLIALVSSEYFPTAVPKAITQFKDSHLSRPSDVLIRGITDKLLFGFFENGTSLRFSKRARIAIKALLEMHREIVSDRIKKNLPKIIQKISDKELLFAVFLTLDLDGIWMDLEESSKIKIIQFIENAPAKEMLPSLRLAATNPDLAAIATTRIAGLTSDELGDAITKYDLGAFAIKSAIDRYTTVRSWADANQIAEKIIFPLFTHLSKGDIIKIIRAPKDSSADLIGSNTFRKFIDNVRQSEKFANDELNELLRTANLYSYIKEYEKQAEDDLDLPF